MNKKLFFSVILVMVLVFGMTVVGCDNDPSDGNNDTWSNVTSFSQVNGSWKAPSSYSFTVQGFTYSATTNNYIITFNATAKTMSTSGSTTVTISGGDVATYWTQLKSGIEYMGEWDGVTVTINDANHSYTLTYNNFSQTMTDSDLEEEGIQINQNGSKLKMGADGMEIIYTKQ
jgi:hypothetical protein